jgi:hypothetical protein
MVQSKSKEGGEPAFQYAPVQLMVGHSPAERVTVPDPVGQVPSSKVTVPDPLGHVPSVKLMVNSKVLLIAKLSVMSRDGRLPAEKLAAVPGLTLPDDHTGQLPFM